MRSTISRTRSLESGSAKPLIIRVPVEIDEPKVPELQPKPQRAQVPSEAAYRSLLGSPTYDPSKLKIGSGRFVATASESLEDFGMSNQDIWSRDK